jgi:probable rRNA maturation factor
MTADALVIDIATEDPAWETAMRDGETVVRRAVSGAWRSAGEEGPAEVSVVMGSDAMIRELNRDWRGQDKPTNVLSFPAGEDAPPPGAPRLLGDIVLAYGTIAREAVEQGKTLNDHLSHLCVHGLLHLLGYDHETEAEAAEMEGLEVAILAEFGIADPFVLSVAEG